MSILNHTALDTFQGIKNCDSCHLSVTLAYVAPTGGVTITGGVYWALANDIGNYLPSETFP